LNAKNQLGNEIPTLYTTQTVSLIACATWRSDDELNRDHQSLLIG